MVGELLNLCYEHETLLRDPVNWTRKAVAWAKGKTYDVPRLRPNVSTSSWGGRYMASKALREYHSGPLMLVFLFMVSCQHNPNPDPDPNPNPNPISNPNPDPDHAQALLRRAAVYMEIENWKVAPSLTQPEP